MKKLLFSIAVLGLQLDLFGQAVPNGTFETWNSTPYNEVTGFNSGNLRDLQRMGAVSVTKVTGYVGSAVRIQTNISGPDTSDSYIINTQNPCSDPPQWKGGVPYGQKPTAITGYYRYNLPGNDTAIMIIIFRKNGVHIGDNLIKVRGTGSIGTWTSFSFPVTCTGVPDTMIFAAASSNKISNKGIMNGSFIELDNLAFAGTTQTFPGGDFETWTAKIYEKPSSWASWSDGVSKSTTSYAGTYAARLETMGSMCGGVNSSGITTGYMSENNGPKGGRPYTNTIDTLCGYYKYVSMGADTAQIYVNLSKNSSGVGGGMKQLKAAANYTYFEMPITSFNTPDTMRVDIASSKWNASSANMGSVLYIDNLYLKSSTLGIFENRLSVLKSFAYPNPAKEVLSISLEGATGGSGTLCVYDALGREVSSRNIILNTNLYQLNIIYLPSGMYFYEIRTEENLTRNRFIKE